MQNLQSEDTPQSVNQLLQALRLDDLLTRQKEIAGILKEFDEDKAASLLFGALLKSPNSEFRKRIVEELAQIASTKAVELLEAIMKDDFAPDVQHQAFEALKRVDTEKAIDTLLSILRSGDEWRRGEAAYALGEFNSDRVVDDLITASKFYDVTPAAIRSLIKIGSDHAIEGLIQIMRNPIHLAGMNSYDAIAGLVRLGTEKGLDELFRVWKESDSIHRSRLFGILSQFRPKNLLAPLCKRLQDKSLSSNDRIAAAGMLGIIGTENEIPLLESIWRDWSEDADREVGWRALKAAEQISFREFKRKAEREHALEETRAFIAHEFRHALTPLNAYVKMFDEALEQPEIDKERLSSLAARIRKQTNAAFDVVNRYLDYSRPLAPQLERADINELLRQTLEELGAELENRQIGLQTQFVENAYAEVDKKMLAQVFRNVIVNALQATDKGGRLIIATGLDKDNVTITLRDAGTGIKPEYLSRVFDIGFTTKSGVRGAGVGLALAKRMIEEAHNGSITITNNTDGPGASVTLTLPIKQTEKKNGEPHFTLANR
ncbi:MAG: two-component system, NtrC family, sensor histidine kinase HydH [Acidobacteriota bacterium]|nr:two-component system, NtrC family, sensor histidine kinase HydH [Acidobacteriota bacterium]